MILKTKLLCNVKIHIYIYLSATQKSKKYQKNKYVQKLCAMLLHVMVIVSFYELTTIPAC